ITSADAAGLPILPGLVRPDEVLDQGVINHALRFTVSSSQMAYFYPAEHSAGSTTDPNVPAMGMRFRLKASYDASSLPADDQPLIQALKTYGMIVADNGGPGFLSGAPSTRWNSTDLAFLAQFTHMSDFDVVNPVPIVSGLSTNSGSAGTTLTITGVDFSGGA